MTDFHDSEGRLAKFHHRLEREKFSRQDQRIILDYLDHCRAQGISAGRLFKIAWSLLAVRRLLKADFKKANRRVIEQLVATLSSSGDYSPATKSDLKKILKKFYKFVRHGNADKATPYPAEVAWIPTTIKKNEVREPDILTEDEAKRMIEAAPSTMDKALIAFLYDGGFRIGEALGMKLGDLVFDKEGARASVSGKTGARVVRLITSAPLLAQYAQQHPMQEDENAPLWYYFATLNKLVPMNYRTAVTIVKRAAERAGIKKRVHPHLFRHSAATRDSTYGLNERILEIKYGWSKGSRMAGTYTHIQDQQVVDNALLGIYAGKEVKPPEPAFRPLICPRCHENNTAGVLYCGKCGCPLRPEELAKSSVHPEAEEMANLREQLAAINKRLRRVEEDNMELIEVAEGSYKERGYNVRVDTATPIFVVNQEQAEVILESSPSITSLLKPERDKR